MAKSRQPVAKKRRIPRQNRAEETVSAILEAAAQILEAGGLAAFTTNAVAERAGVSIGTLYQYFADKAALIRALGERETRATFRSVIAALQDDGDAPEEQRVRAVIRTVIHAFGGRQRARKAVVQAVLSQSGGAMHQPIADFVADHTFARFDRQQTFVLSRAVMGAIRAAVLEEQPFLKSKSFEDELVRLVMAYRAAVLVK
ncbi:MAG TPA: TetR/AcrR family transcriptional regulator [Reyranella sp.]|nr:TetR/AcrR family transcriptional regulator [Reyranella sp.]